MVALRPAGLRAGRLRHRRDVPGVARLRRRASPTTSPCPTSRSTRKGTEFDLPGGTIMNGDLSTLKAIKSFDDQYFRDNVDGVDRALLVRRRLAEAPLRRGDRPEVHQVRRRREVLVGQGARASRASPCRWDRSPRCSSGYAGGHEPTKRWADAALARRRRRDRGRQGRRPAMLHSTLGRHAARAVRTAVICGAGAEALGAARREHRAAATPRSSTRRRSRAASSAASASTRRRAARSRTGSVIQDGKIENYQASCPRPGTRARATRRTSRAPTRPRSSATRSPTRSGPLEVLRTIHSFDPCLACAIHTLDPEGREIARVKAL